MPDVQRLPVQHRNHPHCPSCKAELPNFDDVAIILPPSDVDVLGVIFHVRCTCGSEWMLKKETK